jgi:hypothetical protein
MEKDIKDSSFIPNVIYPKDYEKSMSKRDENTKIYAQHRELEHQSTASHDHSGNPFDAAETALQVQPTTAKTSSRPGSMVRSSD